MREARLEALRSRLAGLGRPHTPADVASALRDLGEVVTDASVRETVSELRRHSTGAGPLDALLTEPGVSDVLVNGPKEVYVDRGAGLERTDVTFVDDEQVRRLAIRLAAAAGRRLDDAAPFVDGRLPDGTRLHAVLAPVAEPGTCVSLRVPARRSFALEGLVSAGSLPPDGAGVLRALVARRVPFLVSGGTGTGKSTLLSALLALVPAEERIVLVEDARGAPAGPPALRASGGPPTQR